ncbi:LacI family DNA-binding transcriptional regulator [Nocardioides coralli]|uniref:LacI family DNA-binding transcriptional regulator n=1 Tax=Nocardioides coralli TaxID=2872154 RepID=UPI001CA3BFC2|nr:LacI family DNA-binding transcriptional regulator [Nocardioides coralli]QZY28342.1 LacI family transcriptional regulator [Nocardioides coralli]
MPRSTIRDVARHAGVSIATVSRVMRDSAAVRPDTRDRVIDAARELEFVPSQLGRQLAERRYAANGIVFPDLSGPYYAEVVLGYENVAAELRRSVLILSTQGRPDADLAVREMADRCDGLVVLGRTVSDEVVEQLAARGTRIVLVARPPIGEIDSVNADNRDSAVALGEHLVAGGARSITFVGDPDTSPDVAERWEGLKRAAGATGAVVDLVPVDDLGEHAGAAAASRLLDRQDTTPLPDALACANDELALGLLHRLREAGVDVPGEVQVSGWDDVMAARYADLTTVRQPMRELGATAARALDAVITGGRVGPVHELLPTQLVVRGSTAVRPDTP